MLVFGNAGWVWRRGSARSPTCTPWETSWGDHSGSCTGQSPKKPILAINFPTNVWNLWLFASGIESAPAMASLHKCLQWHPHVQWHHLNKFFAAQRPVLVVSWQLTANVCGRRINSSLDSASALGNVQRVGSWKKQSPLSYLWHIYSWYMVLNPEDFTR